jgi:cytochrome c-type biogenesis protein CcmH/NrfF
MRRWRNSLLIGALAAACLGQSSSQLLTPEVKRVGLRLACLCGACKNTVGDCPMLECHSAKPARVKIATLQKEGKSDDAIVQSFVSEQGNQALSSPPNEGFHLLAWWTPVAAIAVGLLGIYWFIRRYYMKPAAVQPLPEVDPALLDKYHERIEKDLAKLD